MNLAPARLAIAIFNIGLVAFLWYFGIFHVIFGERAKDQSPNLDRRKLSNTSGPSAGLAPYRVIWEGFGPEVTATPGPGTPPRDPKTADDLKTVGVEADGLSYDQDDPNRSMAYLRLRGEPTAEFVSVGSKFKNKFTVVSIAPKADDANTLSVTLRDAAGKEVVFDFARRARP